MKEIKMGFHVQGGIISELKGNKNLVKCVGIVLISIKGSACPYNQLFACPAHTTPIENGSITMLNNDINWNDIDNNDGNDDDDAIERKKKDEAEERER